MNNEFALQFTTQELQFLESLFRRAGDVSERPSDDLKHQAAQASLAEKNYLRPATIDEELILDTSVAALISVVGDPQSAVTVSTLREKAVEPEKRRLCVARGLIVDYHDGHVHTLTALRTREVALQRLLDFLRLRQQPAAHTESFRIAAEDMTQVPYIIAGNGSEDGVVFLQEKGAPEKAALRLARALDNPVQQSLIQAIIWNDGQPTEVGRLMLLEEVYGLWLMAPTAEDSTVLEVIPYSAEAAVVRIRELASSVLPGDAEQN